MRLVDYDEYHRFVREKGRVVVEGTEIPLKPVSVKRLSPRSDELGDISTTVWSFPKRGSWATHRGNYRGNWAPQIPRAVIMLYSEPGEVVLDQMVGSGTTCIEARLLGRNCIGVDISYDAVMLALHRLYYLEEYVRSNIDGLEGDEKRYAENVLSTWSRIYLGDARSLDDIGGDTIDLVATHPPYYNIIRYSRRRRRGDAAPGDISRIGRLPEYLDAISEVAREAYRVLKPGRHAAVLIGDTRTRKHYVPISHYVLRRLLGAGFVLREEIVKIQHRMKTTRELWGRMRKRDFLLIYHEKLYVLRKPVSEKDREIHVYSAMDT